MFLEGDAELSNVDTATRFSGTTFLDGRGATNRQNVVKISLAFEMTCSLVYFGYSNRFRTGQGPVVTLV